MIVVGAILGGAVDGRAEDSVRATTDQGGGVFTADLTDQGGGVFTWDVVSAGDSYGFTELIDRLNSTLIVGFTNNATPWIDNSSAGGSDLDGSGTYVIQTNGIMPYITIAAGTSITSPVMGTKTVSFWSLSNDTWTSYTSADGVEYVNGKPQAFDDGYYYVTNADGIVFGTNAMSIGYVQGYSTSNNQASVSNAYWQFAYSNTNNTPTLTTAAYLGGGGLTKSMADNRNDWWADAHAATSFKQPFVAGGAVDDVGPGKRHGVNGSGGAAATQTPDGTTNAFATFDGSADYITYGDLAAFEDNTASWTGWFKTHDGASVQCIASKGGQVSTLEGWMLYTWSFNQGVRMLTYRGGANYWMGIPSNQVPHSTWHHLAVTWSPTTQTMYLNGVLVSNRTFSTANLDWSNAEYAVGRINKPTASALYFDGDIDDAIYHGVTLTSNQVWDIANRPRGQ